MVKFTAATNNACEGRPMGPLRQSGVALVVLAIAATGCRSSTELDATGADRNDGVQLPSWVAGGRELAVEQTSAETPSAGVSDGNDDSTPSASSELDAPTNAALVDGLVAAGLTGEQASCISAGVDGSPDLLSAVTTLAGAASRGTAAPPLDTPTVSALLLAVGPCLADSSLAQAAAALGRNPVGSSPVSPSGANPLAGLPLAVDLSQLEAGVAEFQRALASAQSELARNLLVLLAGAGQLAARTVPSVPPPNSPTPTSTPGVPSTLPVDLPGGLNLLRLLDRNAFSDLLVKNGFQRVLAGCIYDRFAVLTNEEIASIPPNGTNSALAEEVLRTIFTCVTTPAP